MSGIDDDHIALRRQQRLGALKAGVTHGGRRRHPQAPGAILGGIGVIHRLLDVFPADQRDQIRMMVSESLRGIVSQQLIPRADGQGRVVAMEIMLNSPAIANVIREAKTFMLPGIIQTGKKAGMILMDESVAEPTCVWSAASEIG